ncbi:Nuclease precursor [Symmachiella dynata]|uniref:DNA/RNA non-specific endonuclease n=1 Tax=Symmachiella dynata TaxID=2527995 RepID=UPI001189AD7C|nr:DNA/RNA non-specific endonuclease [Symmachiella dynata]QDT50542.1 Nuclease precursor [Symmachiella dynata]
MPDPTVGTIQEFVFNGIDATTGDYLAAPMSAQQIAEIALRDPTFPPNMLGTDSNTKHLRELKSKTVQSFGTRFGVNPDKVETAGWGVIFPQEIDPQIIEALRPLLELRKEQAGKFYYEYIGQSGYVAGESKDDFLSRHGMGPGPADPDRFPYYVLLVGDPESISYSFHYQLDVQYAVGRIWFESVDEYSRYAQSVVYAESGKISLPRQAVFFGPQNPNDRATQLSAEQLLTPLTEKAMTSAAGTQWQVDSVIGDGATRSRLIELLGGPKTPALLFTASHGMGFPLGDPRQSSQQGALLCQDWRGPGTGAVDRSHYFAAEDIIDSARLAGLISFHFACYGAGTPRLDDFAHQAFQKPKEIAPHSFVAALPRRLLGHPAGGALAAIGHVERAWGCSIVWRNAGGQIQGFEDAVGVLMNGLPVGYALESINQRYADLSSSLSNELLDVREGSKPADDYTLANDWTANNDARSYVIIGDPAVRLPLAPAGTSGSSRTELSLTPVRIDSPPVAEPTKESAFENQQNRPLASAGVRIQLEMNNNMDSQQISVAIPLTITINVSVGDLYDSQPVSKSLSDSSAGTDAFAVTIDPDYDNREGYDSKFLGKKRAVPLPQLSAKQLADVAKFTIDSGDETFELHYHHFSVVHNATRKLAYFTAVNIDGKQDDRPKREKDKWHFDPRIPRSMQAGEDLYKSNELDRGHLVRRLDPAWGRTDAIIKRANDDTFHFTNCSPQHSRFNQGKNLWAGLEDFLLDKAADEDLRMTVFTGPVFTSSDPVYRGIPIPKKYWKVAVVARPNNKIAALGFVVDQEMLLRQVVSFGADDVAKTFQVPVSEIEAMTGLNFGNVAQADIGSVASFTIGASPDRLLKSYDDIVLPRGDTTTPSSFSPPTTGQPIPTDGVEGTDLRYYLVGFDKDGRERMDHPAGQISRLVTQAVSDTSVTDVVLISHGWQGDVPAARHQYNSWLGAMAANGADRQRIRQARPNFNPVVVGIHWPSKPWGDEDLSQTSFSDTSLAPAFSVVKELEAYTDRLGDSAEARELVRPALRKVLELTQSANVDQNAGMSPELTAAYRELDAAIGLGSQGVGASPSADRDPFDPVAVVQGYQLAFPMGESVNGISFGGGSFSDRLLSPLRTLSYWKMKDRARSIGEGSVHDLLVRLQQATTGRNVRYHLVGHSFGCIVVTAAITGDAGSTGVLQPIDSLILLQGALSLWSYCSQIPSSHDTAGYFHRLVSQQRVRGPIVTTRSTHDSAVGTWYPLASRMNSSVAFDAPNQFPKYGGIGSFGIQGAGLQITDLQLAQNGVGYQLAGSGAVTNVDASRVVKGHNDISKSDLAHLVWSAIDS